MDVEGLAEAIIARKERAIGSERSSLELRARKETIGRLFRNWEEKKDIEKHKRYIEETLWIPLDKLYLAVNSLIRTRKWPSLPRIGEIGEVAERIAGMGRKQYVEPNGTHAGIYLEPTKWPSIGHIHGKNQGDEVVTNERVALGAGREILRLKGGND